MLKFTLGRKNRSDDYWQYLVTFHVNFIETLAQWLEMGHALVWVQINDIVAYPKDSTADGQGAIALGTAYGSRITFYFTLACTTHTCALINHAF